VIRAILADAKQRSKPAPKRKRHAQTIPFWILNDPLFPTCEPLTELKVLIRAGAMPRLSVLWGRLSPAPRWRTYVTPAAHTAGTGSLVTARASARIIG
jgi:hypothetical protein